MVLQWTQETKIKVAIQDYSDEILSEYLFLVQLPVRSLPSELWNVMLYLLLSSVVALQHATKTEEALMF